MLYTCKIHKVCLHFVMLKLLFIIETALSVDVQLTWKNHTENEMVFFSSYYSNTLFH